MNDEILSSPANVIWQQYQFAFNDKSSVNDQLFDNIRQKISSLNLHNSDAEIKYKIAQGMPLLVDVYIREQVDLDDVDSLLKPAETLVFKQDADGAAKNGAASLIADFGNEDEPEVRTVINKGAVKDPPKTSDPLP